MSQNGEDLEIVSESGDATSDEWVKEGSSEVTLENKSNEISPIKKEASNIQSIAANQRHERWKDLLGVRNKPDLLTDWDHLYNLRNQSVLRKDCRNLIEKQQQNTHITVPQLESLITLYCKKRRVNYDKDNGWLDILEKLIIFPFEQSTLFNIFYAITTKYVPKSSKVYDLFRLLLQYHDPELSSYLNSLKIQPENYLKDLFQTLLSKGTSTNLCWTIWDEYFEKGDPFLIFFIGLVFTRCNRDQILSTKNCDEILMILQKSPKEMNAEDVVDLLDICYFYLNFTPLSVRQDFHCMLFGSNLVDEYSDVPLNRLMCLPISVQELYKRVIDGSSLATAVFNYFVIDTRTQKAFNAGSIPGSYNLNGKLIVDEPEKFNIAMSGLLKFKDGNCKKDHICFIGSGLEEDDLFMMMVISKFLHQNIQHISYMDGGYRALHAMMQDTGNLKKLSNHFNFQDCLECDGNSQNANASKGWFLMERMKKAVENRKDIVKLNFLPKQQQQQQTKEENLRHVNSRDRNGKRYRNIQSVFSINEDSQGSDNEFNCNDVEKLTKFAEKLKWTDVVKKAEIIEHFQGDEVLPDKSQISCYIALSRTHMHIFHVVENEPLLVRSSFRHSLNTVIRVTSKKKFPEYLTFKFGYELPTGEAHINKIHCFILPKAGDCAKAIKTAIVALKPSLIDSNDEDE